MKKMLFLVFLIPNYTVATPVRKSFSLYKRFQKDVGKMEIGIGVTCAALFYLLNLSIPAMTITGLFIGASNEGNRPMGGGIIFIAGPIGTILALICGKMGVILIKSGKKRLRKALRDDK